VGTDERRDAVTSAPIPAPDRPAVTRRRAATVCAVIVGALLTSRPAPSQAAPATTVLLPTAGSGNIAERYVKRVHRSLRNAAKKLPGLTLSTGKPPVDAAACVVDAACVARAGSDAGAERAIGALIAQKAGRAFELSLLLVECATGRELARKSFPIKNSTALRRSPGAHLKEIIARGNKVSATPDSGEGDATEPARPATELDTQKTLVLPLRAGKRVTARYEKRTSESIAAAIKELDRVSLATTPPSDPACASSPACIADTGAAAGVGRAVGIEIRKSGRGFTLVYLIVDVATRRVLSKITHAAKHSSALRKEPGARLREILAPGPADRDTAGGAGWAPLRAAPASAAVADGRTAIPIDVSGGPPRGASEPRNAPELPFVSCQGATSLPATSAVPPAIIAPPSEKPTRLSCLARRRGVESEFSLEVTPPGPGLYVTAPTRVHAEDPPMALRALVRNAKGFAAPARLRARASGGLIRVGEDGRMTLELPPGKAPRMIVIALADGTLAGASFVPVRGLSKLKVEAERRSTVRVRIGGEWSGPITARRGVAWVPIEAPPGVERAVIRASSRAGYATESVADLRVPELPRIAAVAAEPELQLGASTQLVVAAAAANGRPAPADARITVTAKLGVVGEPSSRGSGVWVVPYTAPAAAGQDEVVVRIEGDPGAGAVVLPMTASEHVAPRVTKEVKTAPAEPVEVPVDRLPPPGAPRHFVLGAYADGGWVSDLDQLNGGRVGAGVCVEHSIGTVDASLRLGIEGLVGRGDGTLDDGSGGSWSLTGFSIPLLLRFRIRLPRGFGIYAGGGILPSRISVAVTPESASTDHYSELAMAARWQAGLDGPLGPGRFLVGAAYGTGRLSEGLVDGHFEGVGVVAGYEWWFANLAE